MNRYQRAAQIWSLLVLAARNRQTLTYDLVSKLTGVPRQDLGTILEPIQSYCLLNHLPSLPMLVVSQRNGLPGLGFSSMQEIPLNQERVFTLDWLKRRSPTPEDFEAAAQMAPSHGDFGEDDPLAFG